jgi:hypothetical protein
MGSSKQAANAGDSFQLHRELQKLCEKKEQQHVKAA